MGRGRVFSREFKLSVVRQVAGGEKRPSQVCREHGIAEGLLLRWRREYEARGEADYRSARGDAADSSKGGPAGSTEGNKAVVRRLWEEVWNRADLVVADEIFDAAYAAHEQASVPVVRAAFPDSHHTVEDLLAA